MNFFIVNSWGRYWRQAVLEHREGLVHSLMRLLCSLLSVPYEWAVRLRRSLFGHGILPVHTLPARVISVGNLTIGGTGKTPVAALLARHLSERRESVAILSRGYGRRASDVKVLMRGQASWREVGDEPLMLSRLLPEVPVVVSADRVAAGRLTVERFHPGTIILDDGMQHLRLARDVEVVVIDATYPFGNGRVFPAGPLREDLSALRRAHLFFVTRADQSQRKQELLDFLREINPQAVCVLGAYHPQRLRGIHSELQQPIRSLMNQPVLAVSGIGNPASLERTLEDLGTRLVGRMHFPDHYPYGPRDVDAISRKALALQARWIITTEKDAVRLPPISNCPIPFLSLGIEVNVMSGQKELWECLEGGK